MLARPATCLGRQSESGLRTGKPRKRGCDHVCRPASEGSTGSVVTGEGICKMVCGCRAEPPGGLGEDLGRRAESEGLAGALVAQTGHPLDSLRSYFASALALAEILAD